MKKKKLKFLIDENMPLSIGIEIKNLFPDSELIIKNKKLQGKPDEIIYNYALKNNFYIITFDLDFLDIIKFPLKGIRIICRFKNQKIKDMKIKILNALKKINFEEIDNSIIIISNKKIRIKNQKNDRNFKSS